MSGTQNLSASELVHMQLERNEKAINTGKRTPYHLQYARMLQGKGERDAKENNSSNEG